MNDADILQLSLNKYKDQEGRKAKALKERIDCFKALNELYEKVKKKENQRIPNPGSGINQEKEQEKDSKSSKASIQNPEQNAEAKKEGN